MNSIKLDMQDIIPPPEDGDIYIDTSDGNNPYILAKVDGDRWAAISLKTGNRFSDAWKSKEAVLRGLTFFGRNVNISLKVKK